MKSTPKKSHPHQTIERSRTWRDHVIAVVLLLALETLMVGTSLAGNATWNLNPISGDWNTAANWTPETVPGPADIATFTTSNTTGITVSTYTGVGGISFAPGGSAFTFTAPPTDVIEIGVFGVTNNSGSIQNFIATVDDAGNSGAIAFTGPGSAGTNTMFTAQARRTNFGDAGDVEFDGFDASPSAGTALITNEGGATDGSIGGHTRFFGFATAGEATIIANGGIVSGAGGATIEFIGPTSDGGNATLIANTGSNGGGGGQILFDDNSTGDTARVEVFGNGSLSFIFADKDVSVGSLEGDGLVFLGERSFTIGGNNLSTTFSGLIQDGTKGPGPFTKIGTGVLTLSGSNTYSKSTVVSAGTLLVANSTGSATGTGAVMVNSGTLGGGGIIAGSVTIGTGSGTGAFLVPAAGGKKQLTLTIQSALTFNSDVTYTYTFKAKKNKARTDKVIANGVTINGATITLVGQTQGSLKQGLTLTVISNTSANPISGTFANLPDGAIVNVNGNNLQASYSGGDGNDLTLSVVP
jgi:autotransporter-associated beta strand protein